MTGSMMLLSLTAHVAAALPFFTVASFTTAVSCNLCPEFIFVPSTLDCKEIITGAIGWRTDTDILTCVALLPSESVMTNSNCPVPVNTLGREDIEITLVFVAEISNIPPHVALK
jgi:hypothetical protein